MDFFDTNSINGPAPILLILGGIFLLGVMTDVFGEWIRLPRISLLLLIGLALGPLGLNVISTNGEHQWLSVSADIALVMVGFLLGGHFTRDAIREQGSLVLLFSLSIVMVSILVVFSGLLLFGASVEVALLLAGIATATDPAAIVDVIKETRAKGLFTKILMGIVAIDDALGMIAFSILLAVAHSMNGGTGWEHILVSIWEIGGALVLGGGLGFIMARTLSYMHPEECPKHKERVFMETLGFVLLCGGLAIYFKVSFLLASMMLGVVVVNIIPWNCVQIFHAIEGIAWPFLTLFFVFAGASLQPESLPQIGLIGLGYVMFRILGRVLGGWI
jgi:Kef-type K+ transport system membrane component KefB